MSQHHLKKELDMKKLITAVLLALTVVGLTAGPASATKDRETVTMTWYLPAGVDPNTDPFASWWPQTAAAVQDVWCQRDTYRYDTKKHRAIVDALDDDGLLTLVNGVPEDQAVYLSHTFTRCNPKPEPSPTPTPTETTPDPTPTPTPTETTPEPTPTPSETTPEPTPTPTETTPGPTPTPSETSSETPTPTPSSTPSVTPTTPETASSTTSPSPKRPALVQTDVPAELATTGPSSTTPLLMLAGGLLAAGVALVLARRTRRH